MAYDDEVRTTQIAYLGIVCAIGTLVVVLFLQVLYFQRFNALKREELAAQLPPAELTELTSRQQTMLTRRELVDRKQGLATIGISHAMDIVVAELAAGSSPNEVTGPIRVEQAPAAAGTTQVESEQPTGDDDSNSPEEEGETLESPTDGGKETDAGE